MDSSCPPGCAAPRPLREAKAEVVPYPPRGVRIPRRSYTEAPKEGTAKGTATLSQRPRGHVSSWRWGRRRVPRFPSLPRVIVGTPRDPTRSTRYETLYHIRNATETSYADLAGDTAGQGTLPERALPDKGRPSEGRPSEGRPSEGRPSEGRPSEGRPGKGRCTRGHTAKSCVRSADSRSDTQCCASCCCRLLPVSKAFVNGTRHGFVCEPLAATTARSNPPAYLHA
jgi:hypothetical protein